MKNPHRRSLLLTIALAAVFVAFGSSHSKAAIILANPYDGQDVLNTSWGSPGLRLWVFNIGVNSGSYSVNRVDLFFGQSGGGVAVPSAYAQIVDSWTSSLLGTSSTALVTTEENSAYGITNLATIQSVYRMTFNFASPVSLSSPGAYQIQVSSDDNNQFTYWSGLEFSDSSFFVNGGQPLFEVYGSGGAAVPEPSTWAAAALLVGTAGFMRWRKRAKAD